MTRRRIVLLGLCTLINAISLFVLVRSYLRRPLAYVGECQQGMTLPARSYCTGRLEFTMPSPVLEQGDPGKPKGI